ncbi:CBS domain-containing protein [Candidatus Nitrosotenuis chungbukensis]|uniref:CBS domain-containing protein n=1 Tax=Candidatus Nitrosotenuis chungbukensis TaxID=1353246 RepID=UPI0005B28C1D|nr:CBS domain-containing protein [Candidatus Nitrosotenuis chungbukensis]WKT57419.1 CBS domain-containing protein [Candidatus Nitrosotenuis chungbukensis]
MDESNMLHYMVLGKFPVLLLSQQKRRSYLVTAEDLSKEPISIGKDSAVYDGIEKIIDNRISGLIVDAKKTQSGIMSARDVGKALVSKNQNTKTIPVSSVMKELVLVDQYAPIPNCAEMMLAKKTNMIGIKGKDGIIGIMTKHDLVKHYHENATDSKKIQDVMTYGSFFVHDDASMYDGLAKMISAQVSRLLIKNSQDEPVGIVTFGNFLGKVFRYEQDASSVFTDYGKNCKISDVMTKQIITVTAQTSLPRIAKILLEYRIHGVAITDRRKIVGFVTEKDIIRELSRQEI